MVFKSRIILENQLGLVFVAFGLALRFEVVVTRRTDRLIYASRLTNALKAVHVLGLDLRNEDSALFDACLTAVNRQHHVFGRVFLHFDESLAQAQKFFVAILKLGQLRLQGSVLND